MFIRRYLFAGLLFWIPIYVTLAVLNFLAELLDSSLKLIPAEYSPDKIIGVHIPGIGIIISLLILFFTGMLVSNILGKQLVKLWDKLLARIPLVRTIYLSVKQVLDTLFSNKSQAFRKVLLVEYPRKGLWSIAFLTSENSNIATNAIGDDVVTIFIPTTPNPTSGFLMMVPRADTQELNISVDEALKLVISLGVMQPKEKISDSSIDQP